LCDVKFSTNEYKSINIFTLFLHSNTCPLKKKNGDDRLSRRELGVESYTGPELKKECKILYWAKIQKKKNKKQLQIGTGSPRVPREMAGDDDAQQQGILTFVCIMSDRLPAAPALLPNWWPLF